MCPAERGADGGRGLCSLAHPDHPELHAQVPAQVPHSPGQRHPQAALQHLPHLRVPRDRLHRRHCLPERQGTAGQPLALSLPSPCPLPVPVPTPVLTPVPSLVFYTALNKMLVRKNTTHNLQLFFSLISLKTPGRFGSEFMRAHAHMQRLFFPFCCWDEKKTVKTAVVQTSSTDGQTVVSAKYVDRLQLRQLKALNGQHLKEMLQEPGMNSLPE